MPIYIANEAILLLGNLTLTWHYTSDKKAKVG